ncbi:long-chain fatty acid transport protein 6-like [Glandiceps talaboti]
MSASKSQAALIATAAIASGAHLLYPYWTHDLQVMKKTGEIGKSIGKCLAVNKFIFDLFEEVVDRHPYKPFIIYDSKLFSYEDIDIMVNKMSHFAQKQGLKSGDTVALCAYNDPTFVYAWLGLAKLGIKCAFINYNLRSDSLIHCVNIVRAKVLLVGKGEDLVEAASDVMSELSSRQIRVWSVGNVSTPEGIFAIDDELNSLPADRPSRALRSSLKPTDTAVYIYTSGTTGLPKASRSIFAQGVGAGHCLQFIQSDDVVYLTTPLYHAVGFLLGLGNVIRAGATCVMSRKFSVRRFWEDCCTFDVTVMFYVGELCRYLLAAPEKPEDKMHRVRVAVGNGLQPDIWTKFRTRFRLEKIVEFYAASDLPFLSINYDNTVAAVGKFSPFLKKLRGFELVQCDYTTAKAVRDKNGRCVRVKFGEPGLLIVRSTDTIKFHGYEGNEQQTEKKHLRNVFEDGDVYVNSGDLMKLDINYYLYFVDRLGDTFRWKGENVATTEVAQVLTSYPDIQEAIVYGVMVPGHNGRAGMAAVVLKDTDNFNFDKFYSFTYSKLPPYACPKFIRIRQTLDTTGTFKYTKTDLMKEGFDPTTVQNVYVVDGDKKSYIRLDKDKYKDVVVGAARL